MTRPDHGACGSMTNEQLIRFTKSIDGRSPLEDLLSDRLIDAERMLYLANMILNSPSAMRELNPSVRRGTADQAKELSGQPNRLESLESPLKEPSASKDREPAGGSFTNSDGFTAICFYLICASVFVACVIACAWNISSNGTNSAKPPRKQTLTQWPTS